MVVALGVGIIDPVLDEIRPSIGHPAPCAACLQEMLDPYARRYRYPFIHCHDCGPFFVEPINKASHAPCALCRHEATDQHNRRYGLSNISCHACGPRVQLQRCDGRTFCVESYTMLDASDAVVTLLQRGHIVKVQGPECCVPEWLCDLAHPQMLTWCQKMAQQTAGVQAACILVRDIAMARQFTAQLAAANGAVTPLYLSLSPLHALLFQRFKRPIWCYRPPVTIELIQGLIVDYQFTYHFA